MKRIVLLFAGTAALAGILASCSNDCHTCTISSIPIEYCPDQNNPDSTGLTDQEYMDTARYACTNAGGTWD